MVFIDRTGRIVHIHENAIPHDTTPIPSRFPVLGILEVNGGLTRRLGIRPGDRVVDAASIEAALRDALAHGSVKDAAAEVAAALNLPRKEVYRMALQLAERE
jgi:hypothetical protein